MMVIDAYGPPVLLMLPNNKQRYKSTLGGLLTLIVILISLSYSVFKGQLLASRDLNKIQIIREYGFFDREDNLITAEDGF